MWCDRLQHPSSPSSSSWNRKSSKKECVSLKRKEGLDLRQDTALSSAFSAEPPHKFNKFSSFLDSESLDAKNANHKVVRWNDEKSLAHAVQCAGKFCKCNVLREKRKSTSHKIPKLVRKSFMEMMFSRSPQRPISPPRMKPMNNRGSHPFPFTFLSGLIKEAPKILSKIVTTNLRIKGEKDKSKEATVKERKLMMEGMIVQESFKSPTLARKNKNGFVRLRRVSKRNLSFTQVKAVKVQLGDTLEAIATENGIPVKKIQQMNNLKSDSIYENDMLKISEGLIKQEFNPIRPGIRRTNRLIFSRQVTSNFVGGVVRRFGIGGPEPGTSSQPQAKLESSTSKKDSTVEVKWKKKGKGFPRQKEVVFAPPVANGFISSNFGWRWGTLHEGIDLAAETGTPILASERGVVTFAGSSGGYGNLVTVQHNNNFVTRYAHCSVIHAKVGQYVARGEEIAAVGSTGRSTGPHLHFEVRKNGEAVDPHKWTHL